MKISVKPKQINLLDSPICDEVDVGLLVPPTPYTLSFSLTHWRHVMKYVEKDINMLDKVHQTPELPYMHPAVQKLFKTMNQRYSEMGQETFLFPSLHETQSCQQYVEDIIIALKRPRYPSVIHDLKKHGLHALTLPSSGREYAWQFHQNIAEQISPRLATAMIQDRNCDEAIAHADEARIKLKNKIAGYSGNTPENVYFHTCFTAAVASALRATQSLAPDCKGLQIGYPFLNAYKAQTMRGPGAHFFSWMGYEEISELQDMLQQEKLAYVLCEAPCIPLMNTLNLAALSELLREHKVPLIVDDSSATWYNVDVTPFADIIVSSLGGFFNGMGDIALSCLQLLPDSPLYPKLKAALEDGYEDLSWCEDVIALAENARDFDSRMETANRHAEELADWLHTHPAIARVYYPKFQSPASYANIMRPNCGYGGVLFFTLKRDTETTQHFYNSIKITKCLGMGMPFSVLSPYTMLKFPDNLEWAEAHGISPHMLRLSVGQEPVEEIKQRFADALAAY